MAMTNEQLETALVEVGVRLKAIERKLANCVSVTQLSGAVLLLQLNDDNLTSELAALTARVETLSANLLAIG